MGEREDILGFRDGSPIRRHPDSLFASIKRKISVVFSINEGTNRRGRGGLDRDGDGRPCRARW